MVYGYSGGSSKLQRLFFNKTDMYNYAGEGIDNHDYVYDKQ